MIMLPPPESPSRPERRARDRRVSDRRKAAKTKDVSYTEPPAQEAPRFSAPPADPVEPTPDQTFRARGRNGGRRRTDREPELEGGTAPRSAAKPHAPLVAQLIATALNLEQTRVKRRGSERDAAALYGRKAERSKPPRGEA